MAPPGASQTRCASTINTNRNIYKQFAITIVINEKHSFKQDLERLREIEKDMYADCYLLHPKGYEVNSKGQLHMHATIYGKKQPWMKKYVKKNEAFEFKKLPKAEDRVRWYNYCIKDHGLDPYWAYQQYNSYMFN